MILRETYPKSLEIYQPTYPWKFEYGARARGWSLNFSTRNSSVNLFSVELGIPNKTTQKSNSIPFMIK
jgi:hypothetical protein